MAKFFVQVLLVTEMEVEASDELQAERAAYAKLGRGKRDAIGMKVWGYDEFLSAETGAATDDNAKNMDYVRKHFHPLDTKWCGEEAL